MLDIQIIKGRRCGVVFDKFGSHPGGNSHGGYQFSKKKTGTYKCLFL